MYSPSLRNCICYTPIRHTWYIVKMSLRIVKNLFLAYFLQKSSCKDLFEKKYTKPSAFSDKSEKKKKRFCLFGETRPNLDTIFCNNLYLHGVCKMRNKTANKYPFLQIY